MLSSDWSDLTVSGNYAEAILWGAIALALIGRAPKLDPSLRPIARLTAAALVPFGMSDVVEAQTGAWWNPWWLLAWKAACIAMLLACALWLHRTRQGARHRLDA